MLSDNFRFCPKCGGRLNNPRSSGGGYLICAICNFIFYQNSKPTTTALIVNDNDRVLLVKRAIEPHLGKWDLPGGFLENGEDPVLGLKREIAEELGLEIEHIKLVTVLVDTYGGDDDFYTLNVFYQCRASGIIKLDDENTEFQWFPQRDIPWAELAFNNTRDALKTFCKSGS